MTKLKIINVLFFQWFFVRLTKCEEKRAVEFQVHSVSLMPDFTWKPKGLLKYKVFEWYSLQYWVIPCTGWWSSFKYLGGKPSFLKLSAEVCKDE